MHAMTLYRADRCIASESFSQKIQTEKFNIFHIILRERTKCTLMGCDGMCFTSCSKKLGELRARKLFVWFLVQHELYMLARLTQSIFPLRFCVQMSLASMKIYSVPE